MKHCCCRWIFRNFPTCGKGATILSGCTGSGTDLLAGLSEGFNVVGIDYSSVMFEQAGGRLKLFMAAEERRSSGAYDTATADVSDANAYLAYGHKLYEEEVAQLQAVLDLRMQAIEAFIVRSELWQTNDADEVDRTDACIFLLVVRCGQNEVSCFPFLTVTVLHVDMVRWRYPGVHCHGVHGLGIPEVRGLRGLRSPCPWRP
jgi:hypothetical protein